MGAYPQVVDWNNDGRKDLIAGDANGNVTLFLNIGTDKEPELDKGKLIEADGKPISGETKTYKEVSRTFKWGPISGVYRDNVVDKTIPASHELAEHDSRVHLADWDGDRLKDLLVGHTSTIILYRNVGTQSAPRLQAPVLIEAPERRFPPKPSPYVVDWDGDGKNDLLVGGEGPRCVFYRNVGSNEKPKLAAGKRLDFREPAGGAGYVWRLEVTDWNNDGKKDLLVGNRWYDAKPSSGGNLWLFLAE